MLNIPRGPEEITVAWMNEVLAAGGHLGRWQVTAVTAEDSDVPGQTAEVARVTVEYDDEACPLPRSMIAKYTTRNRAMIASVIDVYQQYWREASFYREITDVGIDVPTCYFVAHDPATQEFLLLMRDLAPAVSPSWASTPEQVEIAVSKLPAFHGKWWNQPVLREKDWLVQYDNRAFFEAAAGAAKRAIPRIRELFGNECESTLQLVSLWADKIERVMDYVASRPHTLVHGDYHSKQMFFPTDEGGEFSVIDWQFSFVAQGAWDMIRITTLGQDIASRRQHEQRLLQGYHEGLVAAGVTGYSRAMLEDDLRIGLGVNQMIMAVAVGDTDVSLVERECDALGVSWKDVLLLRGEAAVNDWRVVSFLEQL